jgi:hypothetical protein
MAYSKPGAVREPTRIAVLASPVRQEIVDTLEMLGGEASVAALAEQLGRPADGLYYHLRLLARHELIVPAADGEGGEKRYRFAGKRAPRLDYRPRERGNALAVQRVAHGLMQIARRDFDAAFTDPSVRAAEGPTRQLWAARNKGWVSERDLAQINRILQRLCTMLGRPRSTGRDTLVSLAFVLAPLQARPKRRGRAEDQG